MHYFVGCTKKFIYSVSSHISFHRLKICQFSAFLFPFKQRGVPTEIHTCNSIDCYYLFIYLFYKITQTKL